MTKVVTDSLRDARRHLLVVARREQQGIVERLATELSADERIRELERLARVDSRIADLITRIG